MEDHLEHERRIGANFISQQRHRRQHSAHKVECRSGPKLFLGDQSPQELELILLGERGSLIQSGELIRARGIVDQNT